MLFIVSFFIQNYKKIY